jgi:hypothetical protein
VAEEELDFAGDAFGGVADFGDGECAAFGGGEGIGGTGVCIAIKSETVTNLNPFSSSSFNTQGIASIVPG